VRYFEGEDGLVALDRYTGPEGVKKGDEIYGIVPIDILESLFPKRRKESLEDRVTRGERTRLIYTHENETLDSKTNKTELRESIYIPRKELPLDVSISILPWGIKFFSLNKSNPFGILIEDKNIARNMILVYQLAWQGAQIGRKVVK